MSNRTETDVALVSYEACKATHFTVRPWYDLLTCNSRVDIAIHSLPWSTSELFFCGPFGTNSSSSTRKTREKNLTVIILEWKRLWISCRREFINLPKYHFSTAGGLPNLLTHVNVALSFVFTVTLWFRPTCSPWFKILGSCGRAVKRNRKKKTNSLTTNIFEIQTRADNDYNL